MCATKLGIEGHSHLQVAWCTCPNVNGLHTRANNISVSKQIPSALCTCLEVSFKLLQLLGGRSPYVNKAATSWKHCQHLSTGIPLQ